MRNLACSLAVLAVLALPLAAHADILDYTFTSGPINGSFEVDTTVAPIAFVDGPGGYLFEPVTGGTGNFAGLSDVYFIAVPSGYQGSLEGNGNFSGPQLYTGPESSPTFLTGVFNLFNYGTTIPITLDVTDVTPVPEIDPATGISAMSLLLGTIAVMRGRKRLRAVS